jgi:hypothetical protein
MSKVPETVGYRCDESGMVNEPGSNGLRECQRQKHETEPLISRAATVAWLRDNAKRTWLNERESILTALADALERG